MTVPKPDRDPEYRAELLSYIQARMDDHPRSKQQLLGPSEVKGCPRGVAWKLAYGASDGSRQGWAAGRGVVIHDWLDKEVYGPKERFLSNLPLPQIVPWVAGGTLDLYDTERRYVIDFKNQGESSITKSRRGKPSDTYYGQCQVYALGAVAMGLEVERVGLLNLPSCSDDLHGETKGAVLLTWPVDLAYAVQCLRDVKRIQDMLAVAPPDKVMAALPTLEDFCHTRPCWTGNRDPRAICKGHRKYGSTTKDPNDIFG